MSDEIASGSAWGGVAPTAPEQPRARAVDGRSPLDRRALEEAMVLGGQRGSEDQRAVRKGELDALVDGLAGELQQQFQVPIRELSGLIADPALLFRNAGLSAPEIVDVLPTTGNFPGRLVFLTTDNKLYRWTGTEWTAAVPAVDITGRVSAAQIAEEVTAAISAAQAEAALADQKATAIRADHDALVQGFTGTLDNAFANVSATISDLQNSTATSIAFIDAELATVNADLTSFLGDLTTVRTDVNAVYDSTNGQVKASALAGYYTRAEADAAISADVSSLQATILTPAGQVRSTLLTGYYTRAETDAAVSAAVTSLEADINGVSASVTDEAIARAAADTAEANARQSLATQLRGSYSGTDIANVQTGLIHSERQARITSDSNLQSQINTIVAASSGNFQDLFAAIEEESTARITADSALAGNFSDLTARLDNVRDANGNLTNKTVEATLSDDRLARANADSALAADIFGLQATIDGVSANLSTNYYTGVQTDSAISAAQTTLQAEIDGLEAYLNNTFLTAVETDQAIASASQSLQANINGLSSTVTTQGSAIATLEGNASAGYLIKAQAGGQVSLLDLIAADGVNGPVSVAKISATNILLDGSVTADSLGVGSVTADKIATNAVTAITVTAGAITADKIAAAAVTADKIAGNTITGDKIVANTITGGLLATSGIITQAAQIGDGLITNAKIADAAITRAKIENAAIGTAQIENGAITNALIGNAAITSAKIGDLQVNSAKIADLTVGTEKIGNAAVTGAGASFGSGGGTNWTTISSCTFSTEGGRTLIAWAQIEAVSGPGGSEGTAGFGQFRMLINGVVVYYSPAVGTENFPILRNGISIAGASTIQVQIIKTGGDGNFSGSAFIVGMEFKK